MSILAKGLWKKRKALAGSDNSHWGTASENMRVICLPFCDIDIDIFFHVYFELENIEVLVVDQFFRNSSLISLCESIIFPKHMNSNLKWR